uniref:Cation/H+ exchanger domain-containing protein n=2 Tax=Kalanchoe fedtschenkoi TaxID=63787 RepID=A0A7N0VB82_KALFE
MSDNAPELESTDCGGLNFFNPMISVGAQMFCILVIAQFFQLVLKPLGQTGPIAQILAGAVLGPTVLSRIASVKEFFLLNSAGGYYKTLMLIGRQIIMLMMGLEIDIPSFKRHRHSATTIAVGSAIFPAVLAAGISPCVFYEINGTLRGFSALVPFTFVLIVVNTASPLVSRMVSELKLSSSEIGQVAVYSSIANDMGCLILMFLWKFVSETKTWRSNLGSMLFTAFMDVSCTFGFIRVARFLNNKNRDKKYLSNAEILLAIAAFIIYAMANESVGQNSMIPCFILGLTLPREGKTTRTLLQKLTYPINVFVLPIYFGYIGFQADFTKQWGLRSGAMILVIVLVSIGGKIGGTLAACRYLKKPAVDGVSLGLFLSIKGFTDLLVLDLLITENEEKDTVLLAYGIFLCAILVNTLIAGPAATYLVNKETQLFGFKHTPIEFQSLDSELRLLACVHDSRHIWTMVGLISTMTGCTESPVLPTLVQLIELPEKQSTLSYHELEDEDDDFSKGGTNDYGGNDVVEINEAIDNFMSKTRVTVREMKVVSPFTTMYEDVCNIAEDFCASILILTFHKHQRIDGRMESDKKSGVRTTNQKILRHAHCSVAILVDKGGVTGALQPPGTDSMQQYAVLFFGGPDDREALAFSRRMGMHPHVNLTVIRFLHTSSKHNVEIDFDSRGHEEVLMSVSCRGYDMKVDNEFISDFYARDVASGQIGFVEKYVNDGADTVRALQDMGDMYSLFIVGKGGKYDSQMTTGMSDWEECPELGKIGDLLASEELDFRGSILVIQQKKTSANDYIDD